MKSINPKKKSSTGIWLVLATILMVLILVFTCARKGVINIPGITPEAPPAPTMELGYLDAAAASGTNAAEVIKFKTVEVSDNIIIPDDAVTPADDLSGYVLKLDLFANTTVSWSMLCPLGTEERDNDSTRRIEVTYVQPVGSPKVGEYVDIRLKISNSANAYRYNDYVVVAKKEILGIDGTTITLELNEDELLRLTSAGVEAAIANNEKGNNKASGTLYTTVYAQNYYERATVTYANEQLETALLANPNFLNNPDGFYESMTGSQEQE